MNARRLAHLWLNGDGPFRPRYIAQELVLRVALRNAVKAAMIAADLNDGSRSLSCGTTFALNMFAYETNPDAWRARARQEWEIQNTINECRRGKPIGRLP